MLWGVLCFSLSNSFSQNISPVTWQEQLNNIKNDPYKENKGDISHLYLMGYTYKGMIKSEAEKSEIIDSLLSYNAVTLLHLPSIVVSDTIITDNSCIIEKTDFPMFKIIPIGEMVKIYESIEGKNPVIQARLALNGLIQAGFEFLKLKWNYKGDIFYSICIVSNKNGGIVYDPIGSNILLHKTTIISKECKESENIDF